MLIISDNKLKSYKECKYRVFSKEPLLEGSECFASDVNFGKNDTFYVTSVKAQNIRHKNGKFYYTNEDLSSVADWFPAYVIPIDNTFVKVNKKKHKIGTVIGSDKCVVDVSQLQAFNGVNEDIAINEYRFFLLLFNNYTLNQCVSDRWELFDAKFKSSKYDLTQKLQGSQFLKSKDFKVINSKRCDDENVLVGIVITKSDDNSIIEYGNVFINMNNIISIIWK